MPKSVLRAVLGRMQFTLHATRQTPHGASRFVQAMSAWLVKTRRAPSRYSRDARVYGHTTTAIHKLSTPPPPFLVALVINGAAPAVDGSGFTCSRFQQLTRADVRGGSILPSLVWLRETLSLRTTKYRCKAISVLTPVESQAPVYTNSKCFCPQKRVPVIKALISYPLDFTPRRWGIRFS